MIHVDLDHGVVIVCFFRVIQIRLILFEADLCQDLFHRLKYILWLFPPFRAGPCQAIRKATQPGDLFRQAAPCFPIFNDGDDTWSFHCYIPPIFCCWVNCSASV